MSEKLTRMIYICEKNADEWQRTGNTVDSEQMAEVATYLRGLPDASAKGATQFPSQGHNAPCYYCKEPCNALAAQPSKWPIPLCHRDDPGHVKWHHIGCVTERLVENQPPAASVAVPSLIEIERLQEIEHRVWHLLDDSEQRGEEIIIDRNADYKILSSLLSEDHPRAVAPAAPQQEPVAWIGPTGFIYHERPGFLSAEECTPLYAAPAPAAIAPEEEATWRKVPYAEAVGALYVTPGQVIGTTGDGATFAYLLTVPETPMTTGAAK